VARAAQSVGGRLEHFYFAFGDHDALAVAELPDNESAVAFAKRVAHLPLAGIVYTDIARDGMGSGLNVAATIDLAEQSGIAVIASGGGRDLNTYA
jgi:imidazole glycerol phosphate synthase subunit HisF